MAAGDQAPTLGTLSYNGVAFSHFMTTNISATPEYDEAGRVVKFTRYVVTVKDHVHDVDDTGSKIEIMRRLLMAPGHALLLSGFGFGEMNLGSSRPDVVYGPTPRDFKWSIIGANKSVEIEWMCETHVVECSTTVFDGRPIAYNYSVACHIDRLGMSTRTTTGYLEIPGYTDADGALHDIADAYRNKILVNQIHGFARESNYTVSANKTRLDFTVTDTQIHSKTAYPPGILEARCDKAIRSNLGKGFVDWQLDISGSFTTAANTSGREGWQGMLPIIREVLLSVPANGFFTEKGATVRANLFLLSVSMREEIFGRSTSFALSFQVLCNLDKILAAANFWVPAVGNWSTWQDSLGNAFGNRGEAQLVLGKECDALVNMCSPIIPPITGNSQSAYAAGGTYDQLGLTKPDKETSYSEGEMELKIESKKTTFRHSPIKATPASPATPTTPGPNNEMSGLDFASTNGTTFTANADDDLIQTVGEPSYDVRLVGHIVRVGYPIELPQLLRLGGRDTHLVDTLVTQKIVGGTSDVPVYAMAFDCAYVLENAPSSGNMAMPPDFSTGQNALETPA